jgi:SAM-dependent methyltransferase
MRDRLRLIAGRIARSTPETLKDALPDPVRQVVRDAYSWAGTDRQWLHHLPWRSYTRMDYPEFDLCQPLDEQNDRYDLVICEQVLEHVADPLAAVGTLRRMCADDGHVYVSTPFLLPLHDHPDDYWRFTPSGLQRLLESQGLSPCWVRSWGNRRVVAANFDRWVAYRPWKTLRNEAHLPIVVWALAVPAR